MVNPGAFRGSRREFLISKKAEYSRAVISNDVADVVANIQRLYLKRYPIDLPHNKEPDEAFLQAVDDNAPDPEPEEPNPEVMTEAEYQGAVAKSIVRKKELEYRKKQIKRWLSYQYIKDNDIRSKETGAYMPYTTLMKQLNGRDYVRPRLKTPTNVWRKTQRELIEAHLQGEIKLQQRLGKPILLAQHAAVRDRIARELFAELPEEVKREWRQKASDEHRVALQKYKEDVNADPSMAPADLQMAIQGLVQFTQPILDMIAAVTGWKVTMLAGGPEPALGGRLSVISMHSGYTSGDVKMTYGRAERKRYKKHVIPSFGSFLKLCYTPEECRTRGLPEDEGFMSMSAVENDTDETTYHLIESDMPALHEPELDEDDSDEASNEPTGTSSTSPSTKSSTPPSTSSEDKDHTTQDSMASDTNPFPFEDLDEDDIADEVMSPLPSAPPSPASSRNVSPAPVTTLSTTQHPEGDAALAAAATSIPPVPLSSSLNGNTTGMETQTDAVIQKSTKRKITKATPVATEPVSKRARTKTIRAIASEEQSAVRKQRSLGKKAAVTLGGKENGAAKSKKAKRG